MNADLQLELGHIKRLKEKVAALAANVERTKQEQERLEPRLLAAQKKKEALERDLRRLQLTEHDLGFEVDPNILRELDNPMETDVLTAAEYQEKMQKLVPVLSELLQRTVNNYTAAHAEQEDQEGDFEQRVTDAVQARSMLTEELANTQKTVEEEQLKRIREYETIQQLEATLAATDAEIWLSRTDSHRLSDQLTLLTVKSKALPCKRDQKEHGKKEEKEGQKTVDRALAAYNKIVSSTDHIIDSRSVATFSCQKEESVVEMPPPAQDTGDGLTSQELQKLLPQILGMVTSFPRCSADNRSTISFPKPSKTKKASGSQIDLKEIIRHGLQVFDVELDE